MNSYSETIRIHSYQTDQYKQATIPAIFNFMLDAAWAHARVMNWGYDFLYKKNMLWVLSRIYTQIERLPMWQEKITLETWSSGTDGIYAYREFILKDEHGDPILTANSAWLILDMDSRKIVMLRDYLDTFPRLAGHEVCREPKRLRHKISKEALNYEPVRFSDIDFNQHFNSVKALERVLDNYGIDFRQHFEPATIEINYLKEGHPGDELAVIRSRIREQLHQSSIFRKDDGAELSTFEIEWRERRNAISPASL